LAQAELKRGLRSTHLGAGQKIKQRLIFRVFDISKCETPLPRGLQNPVAVKR
jgi:hypothetical protein